MIKKCVINLFIIKLFLYSVENIIYFFEIIYFLAKQLAFF